MTDAARRLIIRLLAPASAEAEGIVIATDPTDDIRKGEPHALGQGHRHRRYHHHRGVVFVIVPMVINMMIGDGEMPSLPHLPGYEG